MRQTKVIAPQWWLGPFLLISALPLRSDAPPFRAPIETRPDLRVRHLRIPAPRGLITDRNGEPLVQTRAARYLAAHLPSFRALGNASAIHQAIQGQLGAMENLPGVDFTRDDLERHWKHRSELPFPLTKPLSEEESERVAALIENRIGFSLETRFVREYPAGASAAHLTGFVRETMPFQHGPMADPEPRWPDSEGVAGLEKSLDAEISGQAGLASLVFDGSGALVEEKLLEPAIAGHTVVTTINRPMQQLAHEILRDGDRPAAFVAVDALSGDILAMVSYPSFDPAGFVGGISETDYEALENDPDGPLFPKARLGVYPPGSTFKPIVAIAALDCGVVRGTLTRFPCPPQLEIQGRVFKNWSGRDEGFMDVRHALVRSSNTWFYQAGMLTGGDRILAAARGFGFGQAPEIHLPAAAGTLPSPRDLGALQAVANLSIGQGDLLVSPLQLTLAMAGLSAGTAVPEARLIQQVQDAGTNEVLRHFPTETLSRFNTRLGDREAVRAGMWGVVNHPLGTGRSAAHPLPEVFGKTGTSQWRDGRNVAWFAGYVGSNAPRIALVAMVQGREGESLSGGKDAGPIVARWVSAVYGEPGRFGVRNTTPRPTNYLPDPMPTTPPAIPLPHQWTGTVPGADPSRTRIAPEPPRPISLRRFLFPRGRWYRSTEP